MFFWTGKELNNIVKKGELRVSDNRQIEMLANYGDAKAFPSLMQCNQQAKKVAMTQQF
jgi:hypothetical protein